MEILAFIILALGCFIVWMSIITDKWIPFFLGIAAMLVAVTLFMGG